MKSTLNEQDIQSIVTGGHADPFRILGMHPVLAEGGQAVAVRAFLPGAESVRVVEDGRRPREMARLHPDGFFEAVLADRRALFTYRLEAVYSGGEARQIVDPYAFPPVLTDYDLHLVSEGNHLRVYEKLGAHPMAVQGVSGVLFAVWAPNALRVSVVGDFNGWDGRRHPMRCRGHSGVWELFVPELAAGALYKYEIKARGGALLVKSDPFAFRMELRPQTASIVHALSADGWTDGGWMAERDGTDPLRRPVAIYEVHPGSWRRVPEAGNRPLTYREIARELVAYVTDMGYTHIELLPVMEHPLDASWGYQTVGYYAPTSRYGTPEDFRYLVNHCHENGVGVILDWTPAHFPSDAHGLARFDGTALYEHEDPRQGLHPDWGTMIFNYDRNEVRNFLCANALFWFEQYHIDGLRVDAVASMLYLDYSRKAGEWTPNRYGGNENLGAITFLKDLNRAVYSRFPGAMMIAEESTSWPGVSRPVHLGGLGFGFKWNMGWMNDSLDYISKDPVHRKFHHDRLTFSLLYAFHENFILVLSHDEVVHGKRALLDKMPGDLWQKFANLRAFYGYMYGHPGKKLLFMGGEIGQWAEWDHGRSLDWHLLDYDLHGKLQRYVRDLNHLYRAEPALFEADFDSAGFEWIDCQDADQSTLAFLRRARGGGAPLLFACNFTPVPRPGYRVGVPEPGFYRELLNSDSAFYGGSNMGNWGGVHAEPTPWHGRPCSIRVTLPPLACVVFKRDHETPHHTSHPHTESHEIPRNCPSSGLRR